MSVPQFHLFGAADPHVLVVNGSRLYHVSEDVARELEAAAGEGDAARTDALLARLGLDAPAYITDIPPRDLPVRSLSLAIAQQCNLGCTYCYAQQGDFGGVPKLMPLEVALQAVERLFGEAPPGERVTLIFLGGEPLLNRATLRAATERALELQRERGVRCGFSLTTNGTLLTEEDADFFARHGFAVTVSLDGVGAVHDRLRPFKGGRPSYERVVENAKRLLERRGNLQVSARVTVTPQNLNLRETLDTLIGLGFHSVGFSPMLSSPTGAGELSGQTLEQMLGQMIECASVFERQVVMGKPYPFANAINALKELHQGTHRPYPCGAGAGYLGVSAEGHFSACHRFVGEPQGQLGTLAGGVDAQKRNRWLAERHVHTQEPCRSCWARYLCGGGCHHEVLRRGRSACDYIRGWLHHCLEMYVRLSEQRPEYLSGLAGQKPVER